MRNILQGNNSRYVDAEEQLCNVQHRVMESTQIQHQEKKKELRKQMRNKLRDLLDNIEWTNIHIIGLPERREREKGAETLFEETIAEKFPNWGKETDIQDQEA